MLLTICDSARRVNRKAPADNLVVQKMSFLDQLEGRKNNLKIGFYRFFRYKNGPYSSALHYDFAELQGKGFVDSETGELLERGRYLLDYVQPEVEGHEFSPLFFQIIERTAENWKYFRGWSIAEKVYELEVPVDQFGGELVKVESIPLGTDILVPERSQEREFQPLPPDLIEDVYSELGIPLGRLDPLSEELRQSAEESLEAALARS